MEDGTIVRMKSIIASLLVAVVAATSSLFFITEDGAAADAHWIMKNGKKTAYMYSDGSYAKGVRKIGNSIYYFKNSGKLGTGKKERRIKWKSNYYDVKRNGKIRKGWNTFGNALYYFGGKLGEMKKRQTIDKITLRSNGKAYMSLDAAIKVKVFRILKSKKAFDSSKKKKLKVCWNWIVRNNRYRAKYPLLKNKKWEWGYSARNSTRQGKLKKYGATWVKKYANDMLGRSRNGNCYGFACALGACAANIGYDSTIICARAKVRGMDAIEGLTHDGYSRHAWNRIGGKIYDSEAYVESRGNRKIYAAKSIRLKYKNVTKIAYNKTDGTKTAKDKVVKRYYETRLLKKSGEVYYRHKNGKLTRPSEKLILFGSNYYYFDNKHKTVKGLFVFNDKLYNFNSKNKYGYYMKKADAYKYSKLCREGAPAKPLFDEIGEAASMEEFKGCYSSESGMERTYDYGSVIIQTFAPECGEETVIGAQMK